jgi:hypothetical protein
VRLKTVYGIAAIIGAILPYATYFGYLQAVSSASGAMSLAWGSPIAAATLTDFSIACLVFWVFLFAESKRLNLKHTWFFVLTNLVIGLSFALPAFLYFREKSKPN